MPLLKTEPDVLARQAVVPARRPFFAFISKRWQRMQKCFLPKRAYTYLKDQMRRRIEVIYHILL